MVHSDSYLFHERLSGDKRNDGARWFIGHGRMYGAPARALDRSTGFRDA
jgi:hypothetical protein